MANRSPTQVPFRPDASTTLDTVAICITPFDHHICSIPHESKSLNGARGCVADSSVLDDTLAGCLNTAGVLEASLVTTVAGLPCIINNDYHRPSHISPRLSVLVRVLHHAIASAGKQ